MGDRVAFGKWLQKKRIEAGYTQSSAAQKLGFVSKASVVGYENGISSIPIERIFHISKVYGLPLSEILERLKEYEPKIYEKHERLKTCFFELYTEEYFQNLSRDMRTMQAKSGSLHKQNYQDTGRRHHKPFLNENGYLEVTRSIYYQTLIDLIEKALRTSNPDIIFSGLTFFDKTMPRIVTETGSYAHQRDCFVNFDQREPSMHYSPLVKTVQIH